MVISIVYDDVTLEGALKLDFLVEELVIVELKAVEFVHPVFEAQLLTYLKLAERRVGLLINFNTPLLKVGIKRLVRRHASSVLLCVSAPLWLNFKERNLLSQLGRRPKRLRKQRKDRRNQHDVRRIQNRRLEDSHRHKGETQPGQRAS